MRRNKLLHVLLMSGALTGCASEDSMRSDREKEVIKGPVADAPEKHVDASKEPLVIAICDPLAAPNSHPCDFAGEESGQEACEIVEMGQDLCCCWGSMAC